jgi:hypothetical protein
VDDETTRGRSSIEASLGGSQVERNAPRPQLSAVDRQLLAEKIASIDGTTLAEANQQVERFLGSRSA